MYIHHYTLQLSVSLSVWISHFRLSADAISVVVEPSSQIPTITKVTKEKQKKTTNESKDPEVCIHTLHFQLHTCTCMYYHVGLEYITMQDMWLYVITL